MSERERERLEGIHDMKSKEGNLKKKSEDKKVDKWLRSQWSKAAAAAEVGEGLSRNGKLQNFHNIKTRILHQIWDFFIALMSVFEHFHDIKYAKTHMMQLKL